MKQLILTLLLFFLHLSNSQNLVVNPSFESKKTNKCVFYIGAFNKMVSDWTTPNMSSTDFFDSCSKDIGIKNYNGFQKPKSGNAYAGMYLYTNKNYREYVQGKLSKTLVKGKTYIMTFFLSLADESSFALKDIQVIITEEQLKPCYHSNSCEKTIKPSKVTKGKYRFYNHTEEIYFSNKKSWMKYSFEFVAQGYESYFSIGNFFRNPKTEKQKVLSNSPYFFSYYYIDDVSVTPLDNERTKVPKQEKELVPEITVNTIYTFKNVLFEFDKATLLKESINELNQLYHYLNENQQLKLEIYGHTDSVGNEKHNKELSEQRAKSVADYLISQGLSELRVKYLGFGSSQPISDNTNDDGRQLNRRVEFKLIDP